MAAQTSVDYDRYEAELADMFDFGKRQGRTDLDTERQANKRRSLELREEQQAAQRRREAAKTAQVSTPQTSTVDTPELSAPTLSVPGVASLGVGAGGPDRATSARIIVVIVAISAIGTVAHDAIVGTTPATPVSVGNGTVKVPTHLRTLGAVLVMGTIALLVNEVDPGIGLVLGIALGLDVGASAFLGTNGLFSRLQSGILSGKVTPASGEPTTNAPADPTSPSSQAIIAWIKAHPGQVPNPQAGPNDFWNTFARNTAADASK